MATVMSRTRGLVLLAFTGLVGCAVQAPRELLDARAAYQEAMQSRAPELAPAELQVAKETLARAEYAYLDDGDDTYVRDLAYIAERKAEYARIQAKVAAAVAMKEQADRDLLATATGLAEQKSADLETTRGALAVAQTARAKAEERMKEALNRLAAFGATKQESRGTVITIPGGVLFESGKYTLLRTAESNLDILADALLMDREAKIFIEGHTDAQGSDTFNRSLSQDRASAVRDYLVVRGIAPDRVLACGVGEARPLADNTSPEGRANNRRVEVVVAKPETRLACALP